MHMDTQQGGDTIASVSDAHGTRGAVDTAYATTHSTNSETFHSASDSMRETAPPHPVASPVSMSRENMGAGGPHPQKNSISDPSRTLQPNNTVSSNSMPLQTDTEQSMSSPEIFAPKISETRTSLEPSNSLPSTNSVHATLIDSSEYDPKIIDAMYDYFYNAEKTKVVEETVYLKNGEIREISKEVANTPPHFSEFCRKKNIPYRKFKLWLTLYDELYDAYEDCNEIIKEFIIDNGLVGKYQSNFAIFAATNLTDMKVKTETTTKQVNVNTLLDQIEKKNTAEIERSKRQALQGGINTNPQS